MRRAVLVAGVDEAGRGPLAGPVFAAAVILDPARPIAGIRDSKQLDAPRRAALAIEIRARALCWAIASATHEEVDSLNILRATLLAMERAILSLTITPQRVQVDGHMRPAFAGKIVSFSLEAIVRGDARIKAIGAASILAKSSRDSLMEQLDRRYPEYGFAVHKGYATPAHLAALHKFGPCEIHRRSFAPVKSADEQFRSSAPAH